jgi:hypothetical protein
MNIPIYGPDKISQIDNSKVAFIPLAWNFFPEIMEKILHRRDNKNDVFISYFPDVKIFSNK